MDEERRMRRGDADVGTDADADVDVDVEGGMTESDDETRNGDQN